LVIGRFAVPAVIAGLLAAPSPSQARILPLTTGFFSDPVLVGGSASARAVWIARAVEEGAGIVRVTVPWSQVAPARRPPGFKAADPSSPGYDWAPVDNAVRDLSAHSLQVLITIGSAPTWAEGAHVPAKAQPGTWRPDPGQFASFALAAAKRYDGRFAGLPRVRYWQPWNEPNLDFYLSPQWVRKRGRWKSTAPEIYRGLLNAFYGAVKSVSRSNVVISAGTAPYGDPPGASVGNERMPPIQFLRGLFCLGDDPALTPSRCPDPPHFDGLDHHPYGIGGPTWHALNADDVAVPDIYKLTRVLRAAERAHHVLPTGRKQLWVTEVGWDSNPPNPGGIPVWQDARWYEQAMYVLWTQGVGTVLFVQLRDAPCIPDCDLSYEGGLYDVHGRPKPAAVAFRFPFVTQRLSAGTVQAWGRSPAAGQLQIERQDGHRWQVVGRLRAGARQVFLKDFAARGRAVLRATVAGQTSLTWTQAQ
jgi:hypothetical protein